CANGNLGPSIDYW
nr:immunoglobulin heavy chain junction region [Macaca mulatta]